MNGSWHMVGAGLADNCKRLRVLQGAEGRILKSLFPSLGTPRLLPTHLLSGENACQLSRQNAFYFIFVCVCVCARACARVNVGMMCHLEVRGQPWVSLSAFQLVETEPPCWHYASRARLPGPGASPASASHLAIGELGLQACAPPHLALQVLCIQSQVC